MTAHRERQFDLFEEMHADAQKIAAERPELEDTVKISCGKLQLWYYPASKSKHWVIQPTGIVTQRNARKWLKEKIG
jgi:hypothetical protein